MTFYVELEWMPGIPDVLKKDLFYHIEVPALPPVGTRIGLRDKSDNFFQVRTVQPINLYAEKPDELGTYVLQVVPA